MKATLTILAITLSLNAYSQCQQQVCNNTVHVSDYDYNHNYIGDYCFEGNGYLLGSNTYNNWNSLSFKHIPSDNAMFNYLYVQTPLNIPSGTKVFYSGQETVSIGTTMAGNDTIYISGHHHTFTLTANNGGNVIILDDNGQISIGLPYVYYQVGDTIFGANPSNNVLVIACNGNVPLGLSKIELRANNLIWEVTDSPVIIEYSTDGKLFSAIFFNAQMAGSYIVYDEGFYRIKYGIDKYTTMVEYNKHYQAVKSEDKMYYIPNVGFTKTKPEGVFYGVKQ